jgi:hypothetical protein
VAKNQRWRGQEPGCPRFECVMGAVSMIIMSGRQRKRDDQFAQLFHTDM